MTKQEQYDKFIPELTLCVSGEYDIVSVLANISAAIKEEFGFFWVGFYLVKPKVQENVNSDANSILYKEFKDDDYSLLHLVLGPFQGSPACYQIGYGKGVCGSSWKQKETLVVPDVEKFPGHIACSSLSKSEIVVPILNKKQQVVGVLDIDSKELATFDEVDKIYLEKVCELITKNLF